MTRSRTAASLCSALSAAAVLIVLSVPAPAETGQTNAKLDDVTRAIKAEKARTLTLKTQVTTLDKKMANLKGRLVETARRIQVFETEVAGIEAELARLVKEEAEKARHLAEKRGRIGRVLVALARMARHPPGALILEPLALNDTIRSALFLRAVVPAIEIKADKLKSDISDLVTARTAIAERRTQLNSTAIKLEDERNSLDALLARKGELRRKTMGKVRTASLNVRRLNSKAESLRELLNRLERERRARKDVLAKKKPAEKADRKPGASSDSFQRAKGTLVFPAVGIIKGRYGQSLSGGLARKGITIATAPGAQVVATYDGRVVYADNFRGYGRLLIIEHHEGYHTLLAGMGRIDGSVGQSVIAGEPIGVMERVDTKGPSLYLELRRNGQPINPIPWLTARKDKD